MGDYLVRRDGIFYYFRRIPREVADYDSRKAIRISLKTRDEATARRSAALYNDQIEGFWRTLIESGKSAVTSSEEYKRAIAIARLHGFAYKGVSEVSRLPLREIIDRVQAARSAPPSTVAALLGAIDRPQVMLSECFERYLPLCVDRNQQKSEHQKRKWRVPRQLSFHNFISVIGDKGMDQVTRKDALEYRAWLIKRMAEENLNADTVNKHISRVKDVLRTVGLSEGLDVDYETMFSKMNMKLTKNSRPPFEADYVQNVLLKPGILDALNDDAKYLVYAMADTGARESELIALDASKGDICLDEAIPYIWIRPRTESMLKTENAGRKIPLVGASLFAFQKMPQGFTRYKNADAASTWINKYFTEHNLRPTEKHCLYSLRHTFKDRLRDIGAPEEVIDELMGHEGSRPRYGRGHILETKLKWMEKIAFKIQA